jgi:hypothetical protein
MARRTKYLGFVVIVLGILSLVLGGVFVDQAVQKNHYVTSELRQQRITLGLTKEQIANGSLVDNAHEAQVAADTLEKHLQSIAPTYVDLTAANPSGKFDPTNTKDLTYAQGLNLRNSMDTAVLAFGVIQESLATGIALIIIGLAIGLVGLVLLVLRERSPVQQ